MHKISILPRIKLFMMTFALLIQAVASTAYANSICPEENSFSDPIWLTDSIESNDPFWLNYCLENTVRGDSTYVRINSTGGDVYAAMELGRMLRRVRAVVRLQQGDVCISACVLVLAGAVNKETFGRIGIHRPYSTHTGKEDFSSTDKKYKKIREDIKNYLQEMNIPTTLFDAMERIPPEEVHFLSGKERDEYGLLGLDPVEKEVRDASYADLRGISKQEYYRREAESDRKCTKPNKLDSSKVENYINCTKAVSWGISPSEYKSRYRQVNNNCQEKKSIYGKNSNEWRSCYRGVMLQK